MRPVLWSLSYSPWSERARWALEHAGVAYHKRSYRPLIDEPALRLKLRRLRGPVTVPILETDGGVLDDSFAIARYAGRHGSRRLFAGGALEAVAAFNKIADRAMVAGRVLSLRRLLESAEAVADMVPRQLGRVLGPVGPPIAAAGIRRTLRKYAPVTPADPLAAQTEALFEIRAALRDDRGDGRRYLLDEFSYADITAAQALAFVEPPSTHLRLTDATRASYRDPEQAERFADLVAWRDRLYADHRD